MQARRSPISLQLSVHVDVAAYGEAEFVFASIKVITITGLIILGIVLDLGGGPSHDRLGFRYWKHPGPFNQFNNIPGAKGRFLAWWAVMSQAAFSFVGTEAVASAGGEARNPRRNIPKAYAHSLILAHITIEFPLVFGGSMFVSFYSI